MRDPAADPTYTREVSINISSAQCRRVRGPGAQGHLCDMSMDGWMKRVQQKREWSLF